MPEFNDAPMIQCSKCQEWFHGSICIEVPREAWEHKIKWLCADCEDN